MKESSRLKLELAVLGFIFVFAVFFAAVLGAFQIASGLLLIGMILLFPLIGSITLPALRKWESPEGRESSIQAIVASWPVDKPLYTTSLLWNFGLWFITCGFLIAFAVYSLLLEGGIIFHVLMLAPFGFGIYLLRVGVSLWDRRIRKAIFYKDHFEVFARNLHLRVGYPQIATIRKKTWVIYGSPAGASGEELYITLQGQHKAIVIKNPRNRKLHLTLFGWLRMTTSQNTLR